ncbi:MAG: hypothetical protein EBT20_16215 [Alphaproteobacteria bacterium]|nr:hypothetical protein [Alphaproteobacteria bacterium]
MMLLRTSLRIRLLVLILVPLFLTASIGVAWQYRKSTQLAEEVFDQKLSIMALAIYRDLLVTSLMAKDYHQQPRHCLKKLQILNFSIM